MAEETVYRDKRGRKLDMLNEFMNNQSVKDIKKTKIEKATYEWGFGTVQKNLAEEKLNELEQIANEPFARTINDPKLELMKKNEIRE